MKRILCVFACLPLVTGAAVPPHLPIATVERADVVPVSAFDRFMKDIGVRKQSSRPKASERRRARPPKTSSAAPAAPALATVPVPTPKPGENASSPASDNSANPDAKQGESPAQNTQTAAPADKAPVPESAPMPESAEKPPVATDAPASPTEGAEVPKPLPKPEPPAQQGETTPAPTSGDEKAAPTDGEQKTTEPDKAAPSPTGGENSHEQKAETPPPPPLEKEDPAELKACLADLTALGTKFETLPAITGEEPGCGIEQPIAVAEILPGVETGGAQMRCETAKALATWMKDNVQPAMSVAMPGRKVTGIVPGSTYACRLRNSASTGKVSEHARGNAIDVAAFRLDNGETFEMKPRAEDSTLEGAFQRTATSSACLYFSTVLSPGSDVAHEDHLHLDVLDRSNGYRYCR